DYLNDIHQTEPDHKLLIIADQFEELYTLCPDADVRHKFLDSLLDVVSVSKSVASHLVLTLRADFLGQASLYSYLAERLNGEGAAHILGPMGRPEMIEAIEEPARLRGIRFEDKLVDRLLDDVGQEEGNLPLLEFTLTELWQHQSQGYLTHVAYEEIGGVKGALSRHADKVYSRLTPTEQTQARYILGQLVKPGLGGENPRRRATQSELAAEWPVVIKLTNARLLLTNKVGQAEETVEIVHEILVRHWGQLRTWIDEDRTQLLIRHRLSDAAKEWDRHNRSKDYLYRAAQLSQVTEIWPAIKPNPLENAFVEASREAERAKRRAKNWARFWRVTAGVVTVLLLTTVAGVIWQIQQARSPWQPVEGFPADSVLALSLTAKTPIRYYAGTANIGVVHSQGEGWNILRAGLPTGPPADNDPSKNIRAVGQVTADPLNPGWLYAPVMGNGIFRSEDYGVQWKRVIETALPAGDDDVAVDLAVQGDLILAVFDREAQNSFYGSSDGGQTWQEL
ncbi:MAG: hypothetical protein R3264_23350, partial [Anaerolineae bacterium]|nr:hypothetical protein [Anaerolineae bacterium]